MKPGLARAVRDARQTPSLGHGVVPAEAPARGTPGDGHLAVLKKGNRCRLTGPRNRAEEHEETNSDKMSDQK